MSDDGKSVNDSDVPEGINHILYRFRRNGNE